MTNVQHGEFEFVVGGRQLSAILFVAVILTGALSTLAYLVGRMVVPAQAADGGVRAAQVRSEPERVIVVDSPVAAPAAGPVAAAKTPPRPAKATEAVTPVSAFREPSAGELYLQLAAVDRGVAEVFAEFLGRRGFTPRIAAGPDEVTFRVLVGPIQDKDQLARTRAALEEAGFRPFLRRY